MEGLALILLGVVMFAHAWHMFGLTAPKTTGILAAAGGIGLAALVVLKPIPMATNAAGVVAAVILLSSLYSLVLAAVGLWDFDSRLMGFYAIFLAIAMLFFGIFFATQAVSALLAGMSFLLFIPFALLFFHLAPPFVRMEGITGWFFLIIGVITALVGIAALTDLFDITYTL